MVLLPSSCRSLCMDRFSLTDSDSDTVTSWSVLQAILAIHPQSTSELIEQLDTLAVTFRNTSGTDFVALRTFLDDSWDRRRFFADTWPKCVELALAMPILFPSGVLPILHIEGNFQEFSRLQIACLVVHQFLCSLERPDWMQDDGSPDFHIWFGGHQPHPKAVHAYLFALFTYFDRIASSSLSEGHTIRFILCSSSPPAISPSTLFSPLTIHSLSKFTMKSALLSLPRGACVISANRYIGFGRTGTQEEMETGSAPEACPAVLLTPPLGADTALVVQGAEALIEMEGYGRSAKFKAALDPNAWDWRWRTMLFMDALEFDSYDTSEGTYVPDVLPGNVDREFLKAYTAFSSGVKRVPSGYSHVVTGLWGCGSFGGNAEIKIIIQWCAASIAGVPLIFVCESVGYFDSYFSLTEYLMVTSRVKANSYGP
jgi:poly(ADP-ribose) glycohydrolase